MGTERRLHRVGGASCCGRARRVAAAGVVLHTSRSASSPTSTRTSSRPVAPNRAESVTVELHQGERLLLTAQAWFIDAEHEGLEHDFATPPVAPHGARCPPSPNASRPCRDRAHEDFKPFNFWLNFDERPTSWVDNWMDRDAGDPVFTNWLKFEPRPDVDDIAIEAARLIVLADTVSWPAAVRAHKPPLYWMAPSLDLNVQFHRFRPGATGC